MENLDVLTAQIRKSNRRSKIVAMFFVGVAVGLLFVPIPESEARWVRYAVYGAIAFFALVGVIGFATSLRNPEKSPPVVLLANHPQDLVWAYVEKNRYNGQHIGSFLKLHRIDGKKFQVPIPLNSEDEWTHHLAKIAPEATFGYDPANEVAFRADPSSLRRSA